MSFVPVHRWVAAATFISALLVLSADRTIAQPALEQKKILTHFEYDSWKSATGVTLSRDGKYVAYSVGFTDAPGDSEIVIREVATGKDLRFAKGGRPAVAEGEPGVAAGAGPRGGGGGAMAAGSPRFAPDSSRVVIPLTPTKAVLDKAKAAKSKTEEMPRATLAVVELPSGKIARQIPYEKTFQVGGSGSGFLIYHKAAKIEPKDDDVSAKIEKTAPAGPKGGAGGKGARQPGGGGGKKGGGGGGFAGVTAPAPRGLPSYGSELLIQNLATGLERSIADVAEYSLTRDGKQLVYTVASKKDDTNGVFVLDPSSMSTPETIRAGSGRYTRLVWDEKQNKLAFFYDSTGVSNDPKIAPPPRPVGWAPAPATPKWHAYVWERNAKASIATGGRNANSTTEVIAADATAKPQGIAPATEVLGPDAVGIHPGWAINGTTLSFSTDASRLYFATAPIRNPAAADAPAATPTPQADRVEMDLWHWKDAYVQPMQKLRGDTERNRSYSAVVFLDTKEIRQISDEKLQVGTPAVGDWGLGSDDSKYVHLTGYVSPIPRDYSIANIKTGERKTALSAFGGSASLSPNGKFLLTFDGKNWNTISVPEGVKTPLTAKLAVKFLNEEDDHPADPPPYGLAGWSSDSKFVLVYDRFDLWKLAADGSSAENLTRTGRSQHIRFRYLNVPQEEDEEEDRKGIDLTKPMLLAAENLATRDTGFFRLQPGATPKMLVMGARRYGVPVKARNADTYILTVQTFYDFPDYYTTGSDFHELKRVTDINPSIRQYNWGKSELVNFSSVDGTPLSGVLVKPENFDPSKKYPMIIYIYERLSDTVHQFRVPNVTRGQVINPTFYASNGYLVLMPDIAYKTGAPGQSALKCILPAIQAVVDKGYVDEAAIGINGQSWGGYQIAYLVTQTNRFKAAVAGAAVSNMVSAYGGIRWGTGLPRQFQYEMSQSRIGETLWKAPMRYIENSPIFMADRVETPLLMIHNDQDDAVPWYQGIEYFLALRRLGKECYLLNYNGEVHNLAKKANARDFAVRMFQFFEHHLKGKPAPEWMVKGVPFIERDKEKEAIKKELVPAKK